MSIELKAKVFDVLKEMDELQKKLQDLNQKKIELLKQLDKKE